MHLPMTVWVQEHAVLCSVHSPLYSPDEMVAVLPRQRGNRLVTDRTDPLLLSPQVKQLPSSLEVVCDFYAKALFKVDFPSRVKRIGCAFNLRMAFDCYL